MRILSRRLRRENGFFLLDFVLLSGIGFIVFSQPRSLQDYEQRCRETADPKAKEKIALEAVEFLVRQGVPDTIARQVDHEAAKENLRLPADTLLFPEIPAAMNDSLAGLYEARLADNLPRLYWMRRARPESVRSENFLAARKIAVQLDTLANYSYWAPLMNFLEKADAAAWHRWRAAAKAAEMSRFAFIDSKFDRAKLFAIHGLQSLKRISDRRLHLDLCLRLQNTIMHGEAAFNLGVLFGDWITQESLAAKYYLRAVSMEFNFGNQFQIIGRFDEALERLGTMRRLMRRWKHIRFMDWYEKYYLEKMAAVLIEMGECNEILYYLEQFEKLAETPREKTVYHIDLGLAAKYRYNFQTAEKEFQKAISWGKGDIKNGLTPDPLNVWNAYRELGDLFLEYNMPEKSLFYFEEARAYAENNSGLLNSERWKEYWLRKAQAFIQKNDNRSAQIALENTNAQFVDSPYLRVKYLFAAAYLYENLGQFAEARKILTETQEVCGKYGIALQEINAILRQAALSLKAQKDPLRAEYPTAELEKVIANVQKSGNKPLLINALALIVNAASEAKQYAQAASYSKTLFDETEALSQLYDEEQRLVFFQHSIYENVKAPIRLDIKVGRHDSAFVKLDYIKVRALRRSRLFGARMANAAGQNLSYLDMAPFRQKLRPDEAIIDYMVSDDTLYAFLLTPANFQVFKSAVARRKLETQVNEYLRRLAAPDQNNNDYDEQRLRQEFLQTIELSHALYNQLLGGMADWLEKINRLYIVPDEFLHALPFNTLAVQDGLKPDFLIDHQAIMYLLAASTYAPRTEAVNGLSPPLLLASVDTAMYGGQEIASHLAGLRNTKVLLKTHWKSPAEIKSSLAKGAEAYFFYAHAEANWDDPWQSYIQFPLNQPGQYGTLTYGDIDSIDWRKTGLVVLAGCETTGNRIYSGAGLSGLQRSLLAGGAKQVLATLWKVDAAQVTFQMSEFLKQWNLHGDAMQALQTMQQTAIAGLEKDFYLKYPHPRYWGAYNLTGTLSVPFSPHSYAEQPLR